MTFYNIIFGILFFGAIREVFVAVVEKNWLKFFMALSLTIFVFNDTLYTSHYIERKKNTEEYTIQMKLLDLLNFLILGTSLIILSPRQNIFYSSEVLGVTLSTIPYWCFWGLLVFYWSGALLWNYLAKRVSPESSQENNWVSRLIVLFPLAAFFASVTPWTSLQLAFSIICACALIVYMTIYKLMGE